MHSMRNKLTSILLIPVLFLVGCSTTPVISALNGVVVATEVASVAIPALASSGVIPPPIALLVQAYIGAAGQAASQSAAELKSSDTNSIKASKIISIFATIAVPVIPSDADPRVAAYIQGISAAINAFIAILQPLPSANKQLQLGITKPSFSDSRKLSDIEKRGAAVFEAMQVKRK